MKTKLNQIALSSMIAALGLVSPAFALFVPELKSDASSFIQSSSLSSPSLLANKLDSNSTKACNKDHGHDDEGDEDHDHDGEE